MNKLKDIEAHMSQIEGFFSAIVAGTFPGAHAENVSGLKKYLQSVHSQLIKAKERAIESEKPAESTEVQ